MKEIGYVYFAATILGSGLIRQMIEPCDNYNKEFKHVNQLLNAQSYIEGVAEKARPVFTKLIKKELREWWLKSRYCVQIDKVMKDIMKFMIDHLEFHKYHILKRGNSSLVVDDLTEEAFCSMQELVQKDWPGLIAYMKVIKDV